MKCLELFIVDLDDHFRNKKMNLNDRPGCMGRSFCLSRKGLIKKNSFSKILPKNLREWLAKWNKKFVVFISIILVNLNVNAFVDLCCVKPAAVRLPLCFWKLNSKIYTGLAILPFINNYWFVFVTFYCCLYALFVQKITPSIHLKYFHDVLFFVCTNQSMYLSIRHILCARHVMCSFFYFVTHSRFLVLNFLWKT